MNKKQGRRNLRHARIGQPDSTRRYLTMEGVKNRILCFEIQLPEYEEPIDIYFRPIPTSRVFQLRTLTGDTALDTMLKILTEFVVDPLTGNPLEATVDDWDRFGGVQQIIQGMIEGSGMGVQNQNSEAGPTTTVHSDAMVQAALEVMQGDPEIAAAFRKASAVILDQEKQTTEVQTIQEGQTEPNEGRAEATSEMETEAEAITIPISAPNGTSAETPSSDSPSSSTAT